jgi:hypothetical protein
VNEFGMRLIEPPQPNDRVVAAAMYGQMTADDMKVLVEQLQPIVERGEKAILYIDMQNYEGYELGVIGEKLKHMRMLWNALDKYAIVGASRWMEIWITIVDPLTQQKMKHFSPDSTDEAWSWLLASDG